jgi:sulfotransferase family protein
VNKVGLPAAISEARPPVIVIGAHRSGTTATARALKLLGLQIGQHLDSHDEVRELQKLHETCLRGLGAAWHTPQPFLASIATQPGKQSVAKYLKQHLDPKLSVFGYRAGLTGWWLKRRLRSGEPWGWKEPRTTLFATSWLELFPDARFLHIVRNPLAVAASIQRREMEFQAKGDAPSGRVADFEYCVELAMTYVAAGEAVAAQTERYCRVRFEDIQMDPIGQLRKAAAFCGLQFTDRQMQRAAATIRPTQANTLRSVTQNGALLSRYPMALSLGYEAE